MPDRYSASFALILVCTALLLPGVALAQADKWYRVELMVFSYPAGGTAEQWDATPDLAYPETTRFLTSPGDRSAPPGTAPNGSNTSVEPSAAASLQPTPFAILPSTQREFASHADSMQRSGRYRILFHEAWIQPMTGPSAVLPIVLDRSGDGGPWSELQGTIKLYLSNDINLETNLWLNTQGEYLHSVWSMPPPPLGPPSVAPQPQSAVSGPKDRTYPYRHAVLLKQTRLLRSGEANYIDHPMLGVLVKVLPLSETDAGAPAQPATTTEPKPGLETNSPT
jgi:Peptidoglycan-binding protein, CsiV